MTKLLKVFYKTAGEFIPFQMHQHYPDEYNKKIIQAQNKYIANNRVIVLNHIGEKRRHVLLVGAHSRDSWSQYSASGPEN